MEQGLEWLFILIPAPLGFALLKSSLPFFLPFLLLLHCCSPLPDLKKGVVCIHVLASAGSCRVYLLHASL